MTHLDPEVDPTMARNALAEAAVHLVIEIGRAQRAGSRQERFLLGELAPLLARADEEVGQQGGHSIWQKETP